MQQQLSWLDPWNFEFVFQEDVIKIVHQRFFANVNSVIQFINAGKLRSLALAGNKRSTVIPAIPTFDDLGYKEIVSYGWQAVLAPKGLPSEVKAKLSKTLLGALNDP